MSLTFDAIAALPNGARFVRADLHIHSTASVEDVAPNSGMTPQYIIEQCVASGIEVISITDHNTIAAIPEAMAYAEKYADRLLFVPGIEVTANEGHLLVYFDPAHYGALERLVHRLDVERDEHGSRVKSSMLSVIRLATELGGICVAAHIDTPTGFEVGAPGFPAWKKDLLCEAGLRGLEFRNAQNADWYSQRDVGSNEANERRKYAQARIDAGLPAHGELARFQNSDAHEAKHLNPPRGFTRIKMTALTFDGLQSAFADPIARIRINELVPASIPRVIGIGINGGFLDSATVRFSDNLNVLIGGRGTGKSTAVRAIAFALGREEFTAKDAPFQGVSIFCEDSNGVAYRFDRMAGAETMGRIRQDGSVVSVSPSEFPIEYYGQGELGRVARESLTDAVALQSFLDRHIDFGLLKRDEDLLITDARDIIGQLAPMMDLQAQRKVLAEELQGLEERLKASENSKIKQVAEFKNRLTSENTLKDSFSALGDMYRRGVSLKNLIREPSELRALSRVSMPAKATLPHIESIESTIDNTNDYLVSKTREINEYLAAAGRTISEASAKIAAEHAKADEQVQRYVEQLREKGLASNIAELNELSRRKALLVSQIARIDGQRPTFQDLQTRFHEALSDLHRVREEISKLREQQRRDLNAGFKADSTGPLEILLIPGQDYAGQEYSEYVERMLEGTYYPAELRTRLVNETSPQELADKIESADLSALAAVPSVGAKWTGTFLERLGKSGVILHLRTLNRVQTLRFKLIDRATRSEKSFAHLSDGQKHTILLTIALMAGSRHPLIIDQPEDDLDNRFVADRVVTALREVKEARQVILVTHNANIAVLGDSEQIIVMDNDDTGGGKIAARGSIDDSSTKSAVQDILEGGKRALQERWSVYGL